jgi:hypothetical protein
MAVGLLHKLCRLRETLSQLDDSSAKPEVYEVVYSNPVGLVVENPDRR